VSASVRGVAEERAVIRALWGTVYFPNLLFATGEGAMLPVLALAARHVGATPAVASLVVAVNGLGTMLFDLPAGRIVARLGEARSGQVCAALVGVGLVLAYLATDPLLLGLGVFIAACGWAVWSLVRITHLSRATPPGMRGRALSLFGGVMRLGNVVGPFILVGVHSASGARWAFVIYFLAACVGFAWIARFRDRDDHAAFARGHERIRPLAVVRDAKREFATAGVAVFGVSMLRSSRQAILPLWGMHLGLSVGQITLIFGISSLVDLAGFYPSGIISDRFGRKAVAIPCIVLLSVGHALIPLAHAASSLLLVGIVLGIGNGLGSGIVMTLGADRAPEVGRASVLAVWRLVGDGGTASGPVVDAGIIAVASLAAVGPIVALLGGGVAFVVGAFMRDPSSRIDPIGGPGRPHR
jgi:MFS family permease